MIMSYTGARLSSHGSDRVRRRARIRTPIFYPSVSAGAGEYNIRLIPPIDGCYPLRIRAGGAAEGLTPMTPSASTSAAPSSAPVHAHDLAIDPDTGELIGGTPSVGEDQLVFLTRIAAEAQRAIKEHEAVYNAARAALERLLVEAGREAATTPYGTPTLRRQVRRSGRPDRVIEAVRTYELSRDQEQLIWTCATALDAKELAALVEAGLLPREAVEDIVEVKTVSFLQVVAPREQTVR
jgi:hypothetical protein